MGIYTQRKWFDHLQFAEAQAMAFHDPAFKIPGITVSTKVVEEDGGYWLYLTQQGELVGDDDLILPDYERVA